MRLSPKNSNCLNLSTYDFSEKNAAFRASDSMNVTNWRAVEACADWVTNAKNQ